MYLEVNFSYCIWNDKDSVLVLVNDFSKSYEN